MKALAIVGSILLAATIPYSMTASAQETGFVRVEAGRSNIDASPDYNESRDTSYGLRGGYFFNPYVAIEGFYARYGESSFTVDSINFTDTIRRKLEGFGIGVVVKKNFGSRGLGFYVNGRAGAARIKASTHGTFCSTLTVSCESYHSDGAANKPYWGAGVGYDFSRHFGVSLDYERHKGDLGLSNGGNTTVSTTSVGVEYRF